MNILLIILAIICLADIATFVIQAVGNASNFSYYICRPLWGLISGKSIGMVIGFIIRCLEVAIVGIECYRLIISLY